MLHFIISSALSMMVKLNDPIKRPIGELPPIGVQPRNPMRSPRLEPPARIPGPWVPVHGPRKRIPEVRMWKGAR